MSSADDTTHLRPNSVGVWGIVFFVVAAAAPLAVVVGVPPVVFGFGQNIGAAGAFLLAGITLLLFSVGYTRMSRHVSGPGGFSVYVREAFGGRAGSSASFIALITYNGFQLGLLGQFGFLAEPLFKDELGIDLPWWVWTLGAVAAVGYFGYRDIDVSAKVLGTLMIAEVVIVLIMNAGILFQGGESGINFDGFAPSNIFAGASGVVILFAFASFVGFEATTVYGEEAKDRYKTIPRATYLAVVFITIFYALTFWAIGIGYGNDGVIDAGVNNPGNMTFDLAEKYAGSVASEAMTWLVMTSLFATVLSFHNMLSRYMFSMGRQRLLPESVGKAHPSHRSPYFASAAQTVVAAIVIAAFGLAGGDPYLQLYCWFIGVGTVGILTLYSGGALSVIKALQKYDYSVWVRWVAPVLAMIGLGAALYLSIDNFEILTASTDPVVNYLWLLVPAAAIVGWFVHSARHATSDTERAPEDRDSQNPDGLLATEGTA